MPKQSTFELIRILRDEYEKRGRSWDALAKAIATASGHTSKVDRRKLKRLCEADESVSLSVLELRALDQYLIRRFGEGLAEKPIFSRQEDILDSLTDNGELAFIVAAKYHPELRTEGISRWDMRAVTRLLQTELGRLSVEIHDIIMPDRIDPSVNDEWRVLLNHVKASSIISIGSPLACPASEYLLAKMVGVAPYRQNPLDSDKSLPFYFYFPGIDESICPSTFFLIRPQARPYPEEAQPGSSLISGTTRAIVVSGKAFISEKLGKSHGILVAQRQAPEGDYQAPEGHVFMALCGASGPATLALAKVVAGGEISEQLPKLSKAKKQPILVAVIEVDVDKRPDLRDKDSGSEHRDNRKLQSQWVTWGPQLFEFDDRVKQWSEQSR